MLLKPGQHSSRDQLLRREAWISLLQNPSGSSTSRRTCGPFTNMYSGRSPNNMGNSNSLTSNQKIIDLLRDETF
jgi:hypothetical protein